MLRLLLAAFLALGVAGASAAPLSIEEGAGALMAPSLSQPGSLTPDGRFLAYTVADVRRLHAAESSVVSPNARLAPGCDIVIFDRQTGVRQVLTSATGGSWEPEWAPDGRTLAFLSDRDGEIRAWLWDRGTGALRRASDAIVVADDLGVERTPQWFGDGRFLAVKLLPEDMKPQEYRRLRSGIRPVSPSASTVSVYASPAAPENDARAVDEDSLRIRFKGDLGVIDVLSGEVKRLARNIHATWYRVSPDGRRIAYLDSQGLERTDKPSNAMVTDLWVVEPEAAPRVLMRGIVQIGWSVATWSPDGGKIAVISRPSIGAETLDVTRGAARQTSASAQGDLHVFVRQPAGEWQDTLMKPKGLLGTGTAIAWDEASGELFAPGDRALWHGTVASGELRRRELPFSPVGFPTTPRGCWRLPGRPDTIGLIAEDAKTMERGFAVVSLATDQVDWLHREPGRIRAAIVSSDSREVVFQSEAACSPPAFRSLVAGQPAVVVATIDPRLAGRDFGTVKLVSFRSGDGKPLRGTLLLPPNYREGERCPLMVWVYASGKGTDGLGRFGIGGTNQFNLHMLTTRGYAVLWPDIPVSVGTPAKDLLKAVIPAVDHVIGIGVADPDRVAVMGWSNGGYSTLSLITQTQQFKAAIMNAGMGDLTGFFGAGISNNRAGDGSGPWQTWLERGGGAMGVPPWEAPLRYVENSPIYYLDQIKTPLLMMVGSDDNGIVPFSDQVFVGLKRLKKDVTYLRYRNESHALMAYNNLADYWTRVLAFLDRTMK